MGALRLSSGQSTRQLEERPWSAALEPRWFTCTGVQEEGQGRGEESKGDGHRWGGQSEGAKSGCLKYEELDSDLRSASWVGHPSQFRQVPVPTCGFVILALPGVVKEQQWFHTPK